MIDNKMTDNNDLSYDTIKELLKILKDIKYNKFLNYKTKKFNYRECPDCKMMIRRTENQLFWICECGFLESCIIGFNYLRQLEIYNKKPPPKQGP